MTEPPDGFSKHSRRSGLTDPWEPLYARQTSDAVILGLWAGPAHVNSRGFVHGGLITALADNAMGLSCASKLENVGSLVTVSLSVDFLSSAHQGQWVAFETRFTKVGSTICFADCFVLADNQPCARASATFRVTFKAA